MAEKKSYIYEIIIDTRSGIATLDGTAVSLDKLGGKIRKVQQDTIDLNKGLGQTADASGLASAATVELGRTFSDAGYGIQGVTNNVQQLGSLFTTLMGRKNGTGGVLGFKGAMDLMLKSLSGPLGAIVLFQAVTSAVEYFSRTMKEAKEEVVDFGDALRVEEVVLRALSKNALNSADDLDALKRKFKEVGNFLDNAETTGFITEEVVEFAVQWGFALSTARSEIEKLTKKMEKEQEAGKITEATALALAKAYREESEALRKLNTEKSEAVTLSPTDGEDGVIDPITQSPLLKLKEGAIMANEALKKLQDERFNYFERSDKLRTKSEKALSDERLQNLEDEANRRADLMLAIGDGVQSLGFIIGRETQTGKAVAAAGALIETYSAIAKTLAAFAGKPIPGYAIAQAVATGLFGFAQVKKIYSVNVPNASGGGSGGGGSTPAPPQNPSFNIIGQSRDTQIRDTIEGALGKPIKAYVTTKDIKSGEELDRNTIRGARVG